MAPAPLEGVGRLEQRHDVERRRLGARHGPGGELEDVGHVARGGREADDHPMARIGTHPRLGLADRPERLEDLVEGDPRSHLGRAGPAGPDRLERRPMDGRVLADLERREVEPERRDLPAEVGDVAPGDPLEAIGEERVLELAQLGLEFGRVGIPPGVGRRLAGQRRPRATQSLGDEPEPLAVRLLGEPPPQLTVGLGQQVGVACEPARERARDAVRGDGRGDRLHQPRGDRLVAMEHVIGVDAQGPLGDVGGDPGVAVAVAADPAPPVEERLHARRPGAGPAGVRRPGRAAARQRRVDGAVEPAIQARYEP